MKKFIALMAFIILSTMNILATPTTTIPVNNKANITVSCQDMAFTCYGDIALQTTAGNASGVNGTTTWVVTNWGATGTFSESTHSPFWKIDPPSTGSANDLTITPQSGDGFTRTNIVSNSGVPHWKLNTPNCNSVGTVSYNFNVAASASAVKGTYVVTFTLDFIAE